MSASRITAEEFRELLRAGMPSASTVPFEVVTLERGTAVLRVPAGSDTLRPGGTVAGPALFTLADLTMYLLVMSATGLTPLAVTTDATIHFLRRPRPGVLVARGRLLKEGQRLMVGEVTVANEGEEDAPVAHAVLTYSVPPHDRGPPAGAAGEAAPPNG